VAAQPEAVVSARRSMASGRTAVTGVMWLLEALAPVASAGSGRAAHLP
jgi:hypothetical protein